MEAQFWYDRWTNNQIAFHQHEINALLIAHLPALALPENGRIFVPLCGKTRDIGWLLSQGYRIAGAELSTRAIEDLFQDLGLTSARSQTGRLERFSAPGIDIFAGDIFDLNAATLGPVDASFDRAALVALPPDMRPRYTRHLTTITANAPQLLITFEYDQTVMDGPPFSLSTEEVTNHYSAAYTLTNPARVKVRGGLKGKCPATEVAWLLAPRV
ncbi:thiopurine S-methyltransferase [Actibacterium sp. 188UL27-1]|uniref:thiopurine S-methyltransferase n=1 Tax=Actibacterium sp. 188UL27-1 TaxID=2786961 RepID=UPI001957AB4A|nr:thiopurine S-methyltransferase [Actibacterium sp. 188UL27-1]MBM7066027.1 thiopurine S-methyltransferase [Actibacterium sp. 188UL27-1]